MSNFSKKAINLRTEYNLNVANTSFEINNLKTTSRDEE